ncbi:MAG: hypothetical protein QXV18_05265, partial [Candidatus Nitrosocaldus sp.]
MKKTLLNLLLEDTEFRHAVAGAIGYKEILDRIAKVEERMDARFLKLEERVAKVEEEIKQLRNDMNDLRKDMQEGFRRHDEEFARVWKSIEAMRKDMQEGFRRHDRLIQELSISIGSLGRRTGKDMERLILNIYRDQLTQLGIDRDKARRFEYIDREGLYGLKGKRYEFDIIVGNSHVDRLEVKNRVGEEDIVTFYEKVNSIKPLIEHGYGRSK